MKEMVKTIPLGTCPKCGHKQFVVVENEINTYLTNIDGEIIDQKTIDNKAIGMCCNCKTKFAMIPTKIGFIPATKLRCLLLEYTPHSSLLNDDEVYIDNPMEAK